MVIELNAVPALKSLVLVRLAAGTLPGNTRSSPGFGAPADQLLALVQLNVPPRPVQVAVAGARRSSSASRNSRLDGRRERLTGARCQPWRMRRSQRRQTGVIMTRSS